MSDKSIFEMVEDVNKFRFDILQTQIKDINLFLLFNWIFTTIVLILLLWKVF